MSSPFETSLEGLLERDFRYPRAAYRFVHEALNFTVAGLGMQRHVSGRELLEGIRRYALDEFGPLTLCVLNEWGIRSCIDFGHIVFNLVDVGLLGKTDEDSLADFEGGYDFEEAFRKPFLPTAKMG